MSKKAVAKIIEQEVDYNLNSETIQSGNQQVVNNTIVKNNTVIINNTVIENTVVKNDTIQKEPVILDSQKYESKPFAEKMLLSAKEVQDRYNEVKNYIFKSKGVKSRISKKFDSINKGRTQLFKFALTKGALKLYINLDFNKVDPKYYCKFAGDKATYESVPTLLYIRSDRAVKYAKELIDQVVAIFGLKENKKYEPFDAIALLKGEVKPLKVETKNPPKVIKNKPKAVNNPPKAKKEEPAIIDNEVLDEIAVATDVAQSKKYDSKPFVEKMLLSSNDVQNRYNEIKNYIFKSKGVKSRLSKKFDSINNGRTQLFKFALTKSALKLYINLDFNSVDGKYYCKFAGDKSTYESVPTLLYIRSDRAVKYAKELIDQVVAIFGLKENKKYEPFDAIAIVNDAYQEIKKKK